MKVLIYGANGWIGQQFYSIISSQEHECIKGVSRVDNEHDVMKELDEHSPTHVVSFIGRTHGKIDKKEFTTIDYLEQEGKLVENVRDNLYSPLILSILCKEKNIHFTYLGTGCIFEFDEEHPFGEEKNGFKEDSLPNFFGSSYSVVKGYTDRLMHLYESHTLNLRIRMPITAAPNARNFITKIVSYEKICSIPNSMTVLPELLPYIVKLMEMKHTGTLNFTNPGLISHDEILEMYREIVNPHFSWKNFTVEEQNQILASKRSNNFLETTELQRIFPEIKTIKESIREALQEYKNYNSPQSLLVTGGCGFIGSNFINHFTKKNPLITLVNIDALYYCADIKNVHESVRENPNYHFIHGNLQDEELVRQALYKYQITDVIHFAAQSHVQNSFDDSYVFTKDNIVGTHVLLEETRKYNRIKKFIHVSTDEVYGESMLQENEMKKTEHSILCPTNPYAATKAGAELIAQAYGHSYRMPIIITRGNNVYGPNQYPEKLIPKFITQLLEHKKMTVQGEGKTVRSFLHVDDVARAFEIILEKGQVGEIYNIGADEEMEYSVLEIATILVGMIHPKENVKKFITFIQDRPFNDMRYYISNEKLKALGWQIKKEFYTGIRELIQHFQQKMIV